MKDFYNKLEGDEIDGLMESIPVVNLTVINIKRKLIAAIKLPVILLKKIVRKILIHEKNETPRVPAHKGPVFGEDYDFDKGKQERILYYIYENEIRKRKQKRIENIVELNARERMATGSDNLKERENGILNKMEKEPGIRENQPQLNRIILLPKRIALGIFKPIRR